MRVALVGSPNGGKSALFNRLTGRYVTVSNYPGTSVEVSRGAGTFAGRPVEVIDTPGMRELGLWDTGQGIERAFGEIESLASGCAFSNCTHRVEPGCAVRQAVEAGDLDQARYESFLKLGREQEHLEAKTDWFKQQERKAHGKSIAKAVKDLYKRKGR